MLEKISKTLFEESLHMMMTLPFTCSNTALATILTLYTMKRSKTLNLLLLD